MPLICFPSKMNASLIWRSHMKHENKKKIETSVQFNIELQISINIKLL